MNGFVKKTLFIVYFIIASLLIYCFVICLKIDYVQIGILNEEHISNEDASKEDRRTLRVMSYNVAHYNNDTSVFINDDTIKRYKKMLKDLNPDFIGIQENRFYIDNENVVPVSETLYFPQYKYMSGENETVVISSIKAIEDNTLVYSNGRWLQYAIYEKDNKRIMIVSTHMSPKEADEYIEARKIQYSEMMKWINNEIPLSEIKNGPDVYVPYWDYCIICGDFNIASDEDKKNITEIIDSYGFKMANGEEDRWMMTCVNRAKNVGYPTDSVLCSPNIEIQSFTVYKYLYNQLYSDHYPITVDLLLKQ